MNLKSFLKTTVFAAKPALSQCETVLLQYVYSFKVYSTEKSIYNLLHRPPIYMSVHSQRPGFFRAKYIFIYIYKIQVTAIYTTQTRVCERVF